MAELFFKQGDLVERLVHAGVAPKLLAKVEIIDDYNSRETPPIYIRYTCLLTEEVIKALNTPVPERSNG